MGGGGGGRNIFWFEKVSIVAELYDIEIQLIIPSLYNHN